MEWGVSFACVLMTGGGYLSLFAVCLGCFECGVIWACWDFVHPSSLLETLETWFPGVRLASTEASGVVIIPATGKIILGFHCQGEDGFVFVALYWSRKMTESVTNLNLSASNGTQGRGKELGPERRKQQQGFC